MTDSNEFPGVPGTATIAQLLQWDDREKIKVREHSKYAWVPWTAWRAWRPDALVYVQVPPPRTITLPSGHKALIEHATAGTSYYIMMTSTGRTTANTMIEDVPALAEWVQAWREAEA